MIITTKQITACLSIVISLAVIITTMFAFDAHYAKASDVVNIHKSLEQLTARLDKQIEMDKADQYHIFMTKMLIEYGADKSTWPPVVVDSYLKMEAEYKRIMAKYGEVR